MWCKRLLSQEDMGASLWGGGEMVIETDVEPKIPIGLSVLLLLEQHHLDTLSIIV